ncbi:MAG: hypothetical protein HY815_19835, partial [Candidatus Riflebacteria bacterium]|nr:hypothetical protein [Candidatus Riflebacteria bacterium]
MVYFEFIKNRHYFYAWSTLVVLAGLLLPFTTRFQLRWGLDFVGGTEFLIRCEKGIGDDPIRKALENKELVKLDASMQRVTGGSFVGDAAVGSSFIVRTKLQPDEIRGIDDKLVRVLSKELGQKCERQATNSIGPVVGESLLLVARGGETVPGDTLARFSSLH